jgi:hypothetical protein
MMHGMIAELEQIIAAGQALSGAGEFDAATLGTWLQRREHIFSQFETAKSQWNSDELQTVRSLSEQILDLDGALLVKLQDGLSCLGSELAATRKLSRFAHTRAIYPPAAFFRRAV